MDKLSQFLVSIWVNLEIIFATPMIIFPFTWGQFILGVIVATNVVGIVRWVLGIGVGDEFSGYFRDSRRERLANNRGIKIEDSRKGDRH